MKKRIFSVICIFMVLFSCIPVYAMVPQEVKVSNEIAPRGVFSEYVTLGAQNGAGAYVQILKNDVGNRIYIMGVNMVRAGGDIGVPASSIYITHSIRDNGAYANITVHYTYWGTPKSKFYTVYAY